MAIKLGQWSLLALLIATAVLPVAVYALVKATPIIASIAITLGTLGWIAMVIVCFTERDEPQAIARGIAVAAFVYALAFFYTDQTEPYQKRSLATSRLLDISFEYCMTQTEVPASDGRGIRTVVSPDRIAFKIVGQVYWCVAFGLAGGYFARWVYRRRKRREAKLPLSATPEQRDRTEIPS